MLQYQLQFDAHGKTHNQDVKANINENLVQYHVVETEKETWIVNDFHRV